MQRLSEGARDWIVAQWNGGKTTSQIAVGLFDTFGIVKTRSAICGLVDRDPRCMHNADKKPNSKPMRVREPAPKVPRAANVVRLPAPKPRPAPPSDEPAAIGPVGDFPATGHCRFIAGSPRGGFQCCGHPTAGVTDPWCGWHLDHRIKPKQAAA